MDLHRTLSFGLLAAHPEDAAGVLEELPDEAVVGFLAEAPALPAAEALRRMAPLRAARLLASLPGEVARGLLTNLGLDESANLLRRVEPDAREALVDALPESERASLRTLLRFPEHTAGALMDPHVLALPGDMTTGQANAHIRDSPKNVRYNLYVVDRGQVLVGVLNLHELLQAGRDELLVDVAHAEVLSIRADADEIAVVRHPAWSTARSLPVIDAGGVYLGAIRFRTLRRLEEQLAEGTEPDDGAVTVQALGDLFWTGMAGMFGTVTAAVRPSGGERHDDA